MLKYVRVCLEFPNDVELCRTFPVMRDDTRAHLQVLPKLIEDHVLFYCELFLVILGFT